MLLISGKRIVSSLVADRASRLVAVALAVLAAAACSPTPTAGTSDDDTASGGTDVAVAGTDTASSGTDAVQVNDTQDIQAAPDADAAAPGSDTSDAVAPGDDVADTVAPGNDVADTGPGGDVAIQDVPDVDVTSPDTADSAGATVCTSDGDCKVSGQVCIASKCQAPVCAANALVCDPGTPSDVFKCAQDGKSSTSAGTCPAATVCGPFVGPHPCDAFCGQQAPSGCYCDANCLTNGDCCDVLANSPDLNAPVNDCAGSTCGQCNTGVTSTSACYDKVCTPGGGCDGNKATLCNATGTAVIGNPVDCGAKTCMAGACNVCKPSTATCDGQTLKTCAADGQSIASSAACGATEFCSDIGDGKASCKAQICAPNASTCDGNKAETCNATGSGFSSGPTECANGKCLSGACKPFVCTPSAITCDGQNLKTCAADGFSVASSTACGAGTFCSDTGDGKASCQAQICTPNEKTCNGNQAQTCNAAGSGYSAGPAECSGGKCVAGVCQAFACTASAVTCNGQSIQTCAADGLSVASSVPCAATEYCDATGGTVSCKTQICTPNAKTCDANKAETCNSAGSGYSAGPTECSGGKCVAGVCKAFVCTASNVTCVAQKLQVCAPDGLSVLTTTACGATEYCSDTGDGLATCKAQVCKPTGAYCDGTKASVCDAFGSGSMPNAVDCSTNGLDCIAGQCQKCGNAVVEGGETCDDGNTKDGDGCSSTCALSSAGLAVGVSFTTGAVGTVAANPALKLSTLTIAAWIRPSAAPTGGASAGLVVKGNKTSGEYAFCIGSGGTLVLSKYGNADLATSAAGLIVPNVWQHVAVTQNATQSQLFLNGKLVATGTSGFNLADTALTIGSGPDGTDPFTGTLADVAIYPSVLADTSIGALAAGKPLGSVGPSRGCWPMREGSGATVFDASGYSLSISLSGTTWSTDFTGAVPGSPTYQLCTPTAPTCLGTFAGTCNDSGTGLASATNCGSTAKNCNTGTCLPTFASCKAALNANPSASNGTFAIDPDGAGPVVASTLYCDMTNGGWTLTSNGGACTSAANSTTITDATSCRYVDPAFMKALASLSSQVKLTSGPSFGSWTGTATGTNSKAIEALQAGGSWHNGATFDGGWIWTVQCSTADATGWPNMYHACGTSNGVHWMDGMVQQGIFQVRNYNVFEPSATWLK